MGHYLYRLICIVLIIFSGASLLPGYVYAQKSDYRQIEWEELIPSSWNPEKLFEGIDFDTISDDDPRAAEILEKIKAEWKIAPANKDIDNQVITIKGYVAPLDWEKDDQLKEFLLVPFFGACIHTPPPPANQIIYVTPENPVKGIRSMDIIQISGTIRLEANDSGDMGSSGYLMIPDKIKRMEE